MPDLLSHPSPATSVASARDLEGIDLARRLVDDLADKQAEAIVLLDIRRVTEFADYFVIASATSARQFGALAEAMRAAPSPTRPRREGTAESGWQLFDFGDIVVHLFTPRQREYYNLESLWAAAEQILRIE